jgi:prevent-host-death family protein
LHRAIGAYEAKTRLPELLRQVGRGDRFTITHRGRPIADLIPSAEAEPDAQDAVEAMLQFEPIKGVTPESIAEWIAEGRL